MGVMPGFKQTDVGDLPENWGLPRIPDVAWYQEGPGVRAWQFTTAGVKLFNGTNIEHGTIVLDTTSRFISTGEAYGPYFHFLADAGDIVIACSGISVNRLDEKVAVLQPDHLPLCMNTSTMRFKITSPGLDKEYFRHFLRSQFFRNQISGKATGSAQLNFGPAHVRLVLVPLPPLVEQVEISGALNDADALIESLERLISKKRDLKQGAMQELLSGRRGIGTHCVEWEETEIGCVVERIVGGGTPARSVAAYWNGSLPWMTVKDFASDNRLGTLEYITDEGLKNSASCLVPRGTLIVATRMALGKAVLLDVDACINQDLKAIFPKKDVDTLFLYYWFAYNEPHIANMGNGSTVMGLSLGDLKRIAFRKPPHAEQIEIAASLTAMDQELAALETKLCKARQIKQGMMQELLTGRIRLT